MELLFLCYLTQNIGLNEICQEKLSSKTFVTAEEAYIRNMELSQARTRSVLQYCLSTLGEVETEEKGWAREKIAATGLSSVK